MKFYNIIFPVIFLIFFPILWVVILPANFLIDLMVIALTLWYLKVKEISKKLFPAIFRVWGFGFLADLIGAAVLVIIFIIISHIQNLQPLVTAIAWNPYQDWRACVLMASAAAVSGYLIYFFDCRWAFTKTDLSEEEKKKLSISLAVFTAPYILFIPTMLLYQ